MMVVFLGIRPGQVPEEPQPEVLDPFRDWQAACSVPNCYTLGKINDDDDDDTLGFKTKTLRYPGEW